jgi:hypothetical protein
MGGACSTNGEKRNAYKLLVGKTDGKKTLGRRRRRWVDNIKMDLGEIACGILTVLVWLRIAISGELL